jgi:hypothetical protein
MNVEIGTEAAQFPEKEYIIGFRLQYGLNMNLDIVLYIRMPGPNKHVT